ncbi:hypothetical protein GCM10023172_37970 [Hymenobacter ginsengisoli]|uniref:Uncharacterized protein n=1 Tax=Hymenobacter ginsengisoli TaxID=1051626 RepID=A0ABP8QQ19_9BACT|nr:MULTISPECIES: hypothetical protein [unclassified Hymenobacter]MBO2032834.1 hypothetical protein [Hymenobacter sp. BT559]
MDHLLKTFALHCGLSLSHYWHLRLVLSVSLGPLLGVLYLVLFGRRGRRPTYSLWVRPDGKLIARPENGSRA